MKLEELNSIIRMSWGPETSFQGNFDKDNPSLGQCAVTALIVNDFMGGKIMRCMCGDISHYYNIINGKLIDLTVEQFNGVIPSYEFGEERTREYLLSNENTKSRYLQLLKNVKNNFKEYGTNTYKLLNEDGNIYDSKVPGMVAGNKKLKIYGKFDCSSALRYIKKGKYINNRVFFQDEETAIKCGYRPCGVCMRKEYIKWKKQLNNN